jgi:HAE1 family hydrophobic/amphiphilic exporter-1
VIILSVPYSPIGLFLAFYVAVTPFGRGGYAAIVLLVGIVVTIAIVLVDYISKRVPGPERTAEAIVDAPSIRIRPFLMTTPTAVGGLMPLLLVGEAKNIWCSLSLGTIGGLIS